MILDSFPLHVTAGRNADAVVNAGRHADGNSGEMRRGNNAACASVGISSLVIVIFDAVVSDATIVDCDAGATAQDTTRGGKTTRLPFAVIGIAAAAVVVVVVGFVRVIVIWGIADATAAASASAQLIPVPVSEVKGT